MWSQIYVLCLGIIKGIEARIDEYEKKPEPEKSAGDDKKAEPKQRVTAPLKEEPIYQSKTGAKMGRREVARSPGHSPAAQLSPLAKKTFINARDKVLSKEQQEALAPEKLLSQFQQYGRALLTQQYIPGSWFQQEFNRRFTVVVLGTPYAELSLYVNAANALGLLAVHSLAEDKFGNVHRDVPAIIRTLTGVITKIEGFKTRFPVHWTDINANKATPEVDKVLDALKTALGQVVGEFEPYSADLGLSMKDVRVAKEAAVKPPVEEPPLIMEEAPREGIREAPRDPPREAVREMAQVR